MLRITETGTSYAEFVARNVQASAIKALAVVVEYTDKDGRVIERVPMVASPQANETFHPPFPFERVSGFWNSALLPGDSLRVLGKSDGIIATECPTKAKVTFAIFQSGDGTTKMLSSAGWQLGPTPRIIPMASAFPRDLVRPPASMLAQVKISPSGQVLDVISTDLSQPPILTLIRDQMKNEWKFNPGLRDGRAIASDITVLFQFRLERTPAFPESARLTSPVTLIEFFPDNTNPGKLEIAYGRLFSGSAVE
jgi:hypothetical protein